VLLGNRKNFGYPDDPDSGGVGNRLELRELWSYGLSKVKKSAKIKVVMVL
jgi:hypothetical protein